MKANRKRDPRRQGLLAKIHIAKKELGFLDEDYRAILERKFKKYSAAELTILELQYLVDCFVQKGWKPRMKDKRQGASVKMQNSELQVKALRKRVIFLAGQIENGQRRLRGLTKKIYGVEHFKWVKDSAALKQLLAALGNIKNSQEVCD